MSMQIINGYKIGDKFKSAVAKLVTFDPTETITGNNVQEALESVDADVRSSIVTGGDDLDLDISPIDADTLGGKYTVTDIDQIFENLSELSEDNLVGTITTANGRTSLDVTDSYTIALPSDFKKLRIVVYSSVFKTIADIRLTKDQLANMTLENNCFVYNAYQSAVASYSPISSSYVNNIHNHQIQVWMHTDGYVWVRNSVLNQYSGSGTLSTSNNYAFSVKVYAK